MLTALVVLVVFAGALTRATFGFGEAVVAIPLLALLSLDLPLAASLMALVSLGLAVAGLGGGSHLLVDRRVLVRLCLASLVGVPLGIALVRTVPARAAAAVLGVLLVGYAAHALLAPAVGRPAPLAWAWPVGVVAGGLGSAYGFHGMPVVVYGARRSWTPETFRATLQAFFLVAGALVVAGQAAAGLWSPRLWTLVAACAPAVLLAVLLGRFLHARIPAERFRHLVHGLVLALGLLLVSRAALG